MSNMRYTIVEDDTRLQTVWECCECHRQELHYVWDHQNIGSPYCAECDEDMVYISTRLYDKNYLERIM